VADYAERHPQIRLLDNPKQITPTAFNIGISQSRGQVIMPLSAHALYPRNYVSDLVRWLLKSGADNVGGVLRTKAAADTPVARAIAVGMSHPFGVGNSYFRIGTRKPRWVDTVPFGCYRREVFDKIGLFDEELVRNQDDEFNSRLLRKGGRILLVPEVASDYYARESLVKLWAMYQQYGFYKPLVAQKVGAVLTMRQLVPALFVLALVTTALAAPLSTVARTLLCVLIGVYAVAVLACALAAAGANRTGLALLLVFPTLHFSYGTGFLRGVVRFMLGRARPPNAGTIRLTR
jgi:hypothetical protein